MQNSKEFATKADLKAVESKLEKKIGAVEETVKGVGVLVENLQDQIGLLAENQTSMQETLNKNTTILERIEKKLENHDIRLDRLENKVFPEKRV